MPHTDFTVMLRLNPLFGDLPPPMLDGLSRLCRQRSLETGKILFQQGDPGDALFGVRRGQIAIETGTNAGRRVTLAFFGAGDLFGEIAVLDGKGRTTDAVATQPTELFALRRSDLLGYLAREPTVGIKLIEMLCQRLRTLSGQIEQNLTMSVAARLGARLLVLADDYGHEIAMTQEQLARSVGATRESVNRQLRQWEEAGVVELRRGRLRLTDPSALRSAARKADGASP